METMPVWKMGSSNFIWTKGTINSIKFMTEAQEKKFRIYGGELASGHSIKSACIAKDLLVIDGEVKDLKSAWFIVLNHDTPEDFNYKNGGLEKRTEEASLHVTELTLENFDGSSTKLPKIKEGIKAFTDSCGIKGDERRKEQAFRVQELALDIELMKIVGFGRLADKIANSLDDLLNIYDSIVYGKPLKTARDKIGNKYINTDNPRNVRDREELLEIIKRCHGHGMLKGQVVLSVAETLSSQNNIPHNPAAASAEKLFNFIVASLGDAAQHQKRVNKGLNQNNNDSARTINAAFFEKKLSDLDKMKRECPEIAQIGVYNLIYKKMSQYRNHMLDPGETPKNYGGCYLRTSHGTRKIVWKKAHRARQLVPA